MALGERNHEISVAWQLYGRCVGNRAWRYGDDQYLWPADEGEVIATVHVGQTFIDTSDAYAGCVNEKMLAVVLKERRVNLFLATKFGNFGGSADSWPD